jgi:hypothetical protein
LYVDGQPRYAGDHLRWVFDVHLLAEALSKEQWGRVIEFAIANRLTFACWDSLCAAQMAFDTLLPDGIMATLRTAARTQGRMGSDSRIAWMLANLRALPTLGDRTSLLKELFFPPASYMHQKYNGRRRRWRTALPLWYAYRIVRAAGTAVRAPRKDML